MATDSFTNSDGTALATHNANWSLAASLTDTASINSNAVRNTTGFRNVAYYYSASSADNCQFLKKGNSGMSGVRHNVCVRANATRFGYALRLSTTGGTHDAWTVTKNNVQCGGGNLTSTIADTADYTMLIRATANGGNQEIRVWINGVQEAFTFASGTGFTRIDSNMALQDDGTGTAVLTDGSPGFHNTSSATQADGAWDDYDDLVSAAGEVSWTPKHDLNKSHGPAIAVRLNGAMQ